MAKPSPYRVQYGAAARPGGTPATSLGRWMGAVTLILGLGLFVHFILFGILRPSRDVPLGSDYLRYWSQTLGLASPVATTIPPQADPALPDPAAGTIVSAPPTATSEILPPAPGVGVEAELLSYFPLGDDNAWEFATRNERISSTPDPPGTLHLRVVSVDRSDATRQVYRVALESLEVFYYIAGVDLLVSQVPLQDGAPSLRSPLATGTHWENPPGQVRYTVRGNTQIDTGFGNLECLEVGRESLSDSHERGSLFYARGIGLVRQELNRGVGDKTIWELTGYRVNGRTAGTFSP